MAPRAARSRSRSRPAARIAATPSRHSSAVSWDGSRSGRMDDSVEGEAHSNVHEVVGRLSGGIGVRAPLHISLPAEFDMTQKAPECNRVVSLDA